MRLRQQITFWKKCKVLEINYKKRPKKAGKEEKMMDFNNFNVNIKLPAEKAMKLMGILTLCQLSFEEERANMSKDAILKEDMEQLNEVIEMCKFVMLKIDQAIINSIDEISKKDCEERLRSILEEIKSKLEKMH